jgi:hypothetical protein
MKEYSAIQEMYYGRRGTNEYIKNSQRYQEILTEYIEAMEELEAELKKFPKMLALYEKAETLNEEMQAESLDTHYCEGFRFGVLMGLDIAKK